jgi:hypothetical protein
MYLQVTNNTKQKHNIIRSSKETLFKDVKKQGWKMTDCKVVELQPAVVDTIYRGADGKNVISNKQYLQRAGGSVKIGKSNLNRKVAVVE